MIKLKNQLKRSSQKSIQHNFDIVEINKQDFATIVLCFTQAAPTTLSYYPPGPVSIQTCHILHQSYHLPAPPLSASAFPINPADPRPANSTSPASYLEHNNLSRF